MNAIEDATLDPREVLAHPTGFTAGFARHVIERLPVSVSSLVAVISAIDDLAGSDEFDSIVGDGDDSGIEVLREKLKEAFGLAVQLHEAT